MSELDQVTLNAGDKSVVLPVLKPTLGNDCIDVSKLTRETGLFTYDSGFTATASCKSAITYIDGDAGVLLYRGYPIEQLAEHSSFLEVAYLLMHGELPTKEEFSSFEHEVTHHTMMHEAFRTFLYGFRHDAHPMAMLTGMLGSLASFYHNDLDLEDPEHIPRQRIGPGTQPPHHAAPPPQQNAIAQRVIPQVPSHRPWVFHARHPAKESPSTNGSSLLPAQDQRGSGGRQHP